MRVAGHGGEHWYFFCTSRRDGTCDALYVRVEDAEAAVLRHYATWRLPAASQPKSVTSSRTRCMTKTAAHDCCTSTSPSCSETWTPRKTTSLTSRKRRNRYCEGSRAPRDNRRGTGQSSSRPGRRTATAGFWSGDHPSRSRPSRRTARAIPADQQCHSTGCYPGAPIDGQRVSADASSP
jgi:hypothetical protein